jgi:RNA polymerase sigma-70 factor (ECF subfamily)
MEAIRGRSSDALAALYDRHAGRVLAVARRIVRTPSEAEEVLEDVFWEVWSRAERFDPLRGSPLAYLLLLARSRALDHVRARQRREARILPLGSIEELDRAGGPGESRPSPLEHTLATETGKRVRAALAELGDEQRKAIELSFFGGLSHSEIAERLGIPLGTVKSRIRRGLVVLRRHVFTDEES